MIKLYIYWLVPYLLEPCSHQRSYMLICLCFLHPLLISFILEATATSGEEIINLFSVIPAKGVLVPNDRPTQVQVIFKSRKEITIKDQPILKCQVWCLPAIQSNFAKAWNMIYLCFQPPIVLCLNSTDFFFIVTVKPVYEDRSRDTRKVVFIYRFLQYMINVQSSAMINQFKGKQKMWSL